MTDFALHRRAQDCIAQAALTNSKRPECHVKGVYPTHLAKGRGCFVWDHRGQKYVDFITGLGTNLLGYANPRVDGAIFSRMSEGASLSLGTHVELETAEKLKELFPFVDAVKFLKTGTEACMAAIRIARAKTGRSLVLSDAYHGWSDGFVSLTPPAVGCVESSSLGYARLDLARIHEAAAVIIEPVITDWSRERIEWLKLIRADCTKHGVMLIFDEIITGFRFPKFSVSALTGVIPDLICLGKGIANGMPLAAVGGKYAVMNCDEYFVSSTYAGETLSLAAAKETMRLLQTAYSIDWLWEEGERFLKEFNAIWPDGVTIEGYPTRGVFKGEPLTKALFFQEACLAGILFGPSWWLNFPLAQEWRNLMGTLKDILGRVRRGEVSLKGELPASPFAERVRQKQ